MLGLFGGKSESPEDICRQVVERLRAELPECSLTVAEGDPFELSLAAPDDDNTMTLYLGNLVADVQGAWTRGSRKELIDNYIAMARQSLFPPPITAESVYLTLRNRSYFDGLDDGWAEDDLIEDGPGDLVIVVIADIGQGLQTVTTATAQKAGFSSDEIRAAAEKNLLGVLSGLGSGDSAPGIVSAGIDGYPWLGTSLLLTPKVLEIVMMDLGWNRALISSVSRESVDFANADDPEALGRMERWMQERFSTDPRPQSDFVWTMKVGDDVPVKTHRMEEDKLVALS